MPSPRAQCSRWVEQNTAVLSEKSLPRGVSSPRRCTRIAELGRTLTGMIGEGAYVTSGNQRRDVGSLKEAMGRTLRTGARGPDGGTRDWVR